MPNVFTPNGDGTNDYFVVDNHGIETLNMLIFNRWGAKVYEWNTTQNAWDGTGLDGEDVADGVYYYILDVFNVIHNQKESYSGNVTIFNND